MIPRQSFGHGSSHWCLVRNGRTACVKQHLTDGRASVSAACFQTPRLRDGFGAGQWYVDCCEKASQSSTCWRQATLVLAYAGNLIVLAAHPDTTDG